MNGPVDPGLIVPLDRLPDARTWREMRDRTWAKFRGRVYPADFNFTFDSVLRWIEAHPACGLDQARWSCHDLFVAMCGVVPHIGVQRCELSGVVMLTISVKSPESDQVLTRTRTVKITEPANDETGAAVPLERKRA